MSDPQPANPVSRLKSLPPFQFLLTLGGPIVIAVVCWIYLAVMMADMSAIPGMSSMMMMKQPLSHPGYLFGLFIMWAIMMAAMMVPTAGTMITAYARMRSADRQESGRSLSVLVFASGYVATWAAYSVGATVLQAVLTELAYLSPMMMKIVPGPLAAGVLITAGIYQLMPLKQRCLHQCRTPIAFLMTEWREGDWGAFVMGWRHGVYCVGCCWALMGLLFVVGVMNIYWIIAIMIYVLIEKVVPFSPIVSRLVGAGMIGMGLWMITA
ncbi:DUF2182 domain-containing protein [Sneathiella sp.]|uniref:DUF2182 domain-containing protein n=1 Tax=Sneathiella sp. TaxID=1964365 RepID=UPI0035672B34